jgi:hypothetical protein
VIEAVTLGTGVSVGTVGVADGSACGAPLHAATGKIRLITMMAKNISFMEGILSRRGQKM